MNWDNIYDSLNQTGFAKVPAVLTDEQCSELRNNYSNDKLYRNTIDMRRYRFRAKVNTVIS